MAKKADSNDKKRKASGDSLKPQAVTGEQKKQLEKRAANTEEFKEIGHKAKPILSEFIKRKTKAGADTKSPKEDKASTREEETGEFILTEVAAPSDSPSDAPIAFAEEPSNDEPANEDSANEESSDTKSIFGFDFDFEKFDSKPFLEALEKFLSPREAYEPVNPPAPTPMVIVADFTLPYRCCEDYVCEDKCYTDEELSMLPIPPFAKDDFAVTRRDTQVDIYPDLNDSHLFKDAIVVIEIEEGQSFTTKAGGLVKPDKTGEHPRFIYTPPAGETGISDSFIYTLYNTKNELSDSAIVWIEVAESIPTFSMDPTTVCRNAGEQKIEVNAMGNEWETIEVNGNGITKIVDTNTGIPTWTFNPAGLRVVAGPNPITLTLNGQEVGRIEVTVNEIDSNFLLVGELISIDGETGVATIALHDISVNAQSYRWEWRLLPEGSMNESSAVPDASRTVLLPLTGIPKTRADFFIHLKLTTKSAVGCTDETEGDIRIIWPGPEPGTPEILTTTSEICTTASPIIISVNPEGNDWSAIEMTGNGIQKTIDANQIPTWRFNPRGTNVVIGVNELKLELNGTEVDELEINVMQSLAGFEPTGRAEYTNPDKPGGSVYLRNSSTNAKLYNWKWTSRYGNGQQDIIPDANGEVRLPFLSLPVRAENFDLDLTLTVVSDKGCPGTKTGRVAIIVDGGPTNFNVEIVKKYLFNSNMIITDPDDLVDTGISKSAMDNMESEITKVLEDFNDPKFMEFVTAEEFDATISSLALTIQSFTKAAPPEDFGKNSDYMNLLNNLSMATFAMLTLREADLNNTKIVAAEKIATGTLDKVTVSGFQVNSETKADFNLLMNEVSVSKPDLHSSFGSTKEFFNRT